MGKISTPASLKGRGEREVVHTKGVRMSWAVAYVAGREEPELSRHMMFTNVGEQKSSV